MCHLVRSAKCVYSITCVASRKHPLTREGKNWVHTQRKRKCKLSLRGGVYMTPPSPGDPACECPQDVTANCAIES